MDGPIPLSRDDPIEIVVGYYTGKAWSCHTLPEALNSLGRLRKIR
jgi:hypothetical protein